MYVAVYAVSTLCQILMLLHYLAIVWVWIGSKDFIGYEAGYDPWQLANEDFAGSTQTQIYIFSVYWTCTVITTVGFGDYSGGTTLEYIITICIEFFGMILFASV